MKKNIRNIVLGTFLAYSPLACDDAQLHHDTSQDTEDTCPPVPIVPDGCPEIPVECLDSETRAIECFFDDNTGIQHLTGTQQQICTDGRWDNYGHCSGEIPTPPLPLCLDGSVEREYRVRENSCGLNNRGNKIQERTTRCLDGVWTSRTPWLDVGDCQDQDRCVDGSVTSPPDACGLNGDGLLTQQCIEGIYENLCLDPAECLNGTTIEVSCGITGEGVSTVICEDGYLNVGPCSVPSTGECIDGTILSEVRERTCGLNENGKFFQEKTRECVDGYWTIGSLWTDISTCIDPDDCVNGSTRTDITADCGINGNGFIEQLCEVGAWVNSRCNDDDVCRDGIVNTEDMSITCGLNNRGREVIEREQTCSSGHWSSFSGWTVAYSCNEVDNCVYGTTMYKWRLY
ncbi:hypothetical protein HYU21_02750 [Candidatus Woesearchaeota archaeon]|nr:hypothetical protein [Candidatus Woesearchaeota archaeon]